MDIRIERLLKIFQINGWKLVGSVDTPSDWWFTDILRLTSTWRPVNTSIYLTLLVDPLIIERKIIWCIRVSSEKPIDRDFPFIDEITLNDINKVDLGKFVRNINIVTLR